MTMGQFVPETIYAGEQRITQRSKGRVQLKFLIYLSSTQLNTATHEGN